MRCSIDRSEDEDGGDVFDDAPPLEVDRAGKAPLPRIVFNDPRLLLPTILPTSESALGADDEEKTFDFEPLLNTDKANFLQFKPLPLIEREDNKVGFGSESIRFACWSCRDLLLTCFYALVRIDDETNELRKGSKQKKVFMYEPMELPLPGYHMRPTAGRYEQRYACFEEQGVRGPRGLVDDGAEDVQFAMPLDALLPPEHDPLKFIIPDTKIRTWVGLPTDFHE